MTDPTDTGKEWKVGQKVRFKGDHPWRNHFGTVVRFETSYLMGKLRPVVLLEAIPSQECFVMRDDQVDFVK